MARPRHSREVRLFSRCRVEFDRPSGAVVAETEDLSARGMFVRTEDLLPIGEETDVLLTLPDGAVLALTARVAHALTRTAAHALGRHPGLGLELTGLDSPARLQLRAHLDGIKGETTSPGLSTTTEVLVVEPTEPLRERMTRGLAAAGFKVTAVAGAIEALEACTAWRPDAVVAAAAMPGMSGIDLAYAMSEHGVLADVPLLLSAEEQGDLARLEAYRAGVRDYVPRPFLDEELVIRVHRVAAPPPTGPRAGLHGRLDEIGLPTLLSLFEFERKSGVLLVLRAGRIARLFLAEGRILKAEVSGAAGDGPARVLAVLDWHDGQFEFTPTEIEGRDEIGASITQLLLEHARRSDEASRSS